VPLLSFFALAPSFTGGVSVAAGDVTGDGVPDVVVGTGAGPPAEVKVLNGLTAALLGDYRPFGSFTGGVNVAASGGYVLVAPAKGGSNAELFQGARGTAQDLLVPFPGYAGGAVAADLTGPATGSGTSAISLPTLPPLTVIGTTVTTETAAGVPVGCTGGNGLVCSIGATLLYTDLPAGVARDTNALPAQRREPKRRTVVIGSTKAKILAGRSKTLKISLNGTGKRLLVKDHTLKVTLVLSQPHQKTLKRTITFKVRPPHKH
jgi:hypothetical protein